MKRRGTWFSSWVCWVALSAVAAVGQGTQDDYARARELPRKWRAAFDVGEPDYGWTADGRLWLSTVDEAGARTWEILGPKDGSRKPLFDAAKVADAVKSALGGRPSPQRLAVARVEVFENELRLLVDGVDDVVAVDDAGHATLTAFETVPQVLIGSARLRSEAAARSGRRRRDGRATSIWIANRSDEELSLAWESDGKWTDYGKVGARTTRRQHTFEGHRWRISADGGGYERSFTAKEVPAVLVVARARDGKAYIDYGSGVGRLEAERSEPATSQPRGPRGPATSTRPADSRSAASRKSPEADSRASRRSPTRSAGATVFADSNKIEFRATGGAEPRVYEDLTGDGGIFFLRGTSPQREGRVEREIVFRRYEANVGRLHFVRSEPGRQGPVGGDWIRYPRPGDPRTLDVPQLFDVAAGTRIPIATTLWPHPYEIRDFEWNPDGSSFTFTYVERGHRVVRLLRVDAQSGSVRAVAEESSSTFVDSSRAHDPRRLYGTDEALWMSERDGWRGLYLFDLKTGAQKARLTGDWVVDGVEQVDEKARQVLFRARGAHPGQDPYHLHFGRVDFDGKNLVWLTDADGTHEIEYSPDGSLYLDRWSRVDQPPVLELRRTADGTKVSELSRASDADLRAAGWKPPERFVAKATDGKTDLWGVVFRPSNFDPSKKYPVVEHVYAGPQGFFTPKAFDVWHHHRELAELGFVVVQLDAPGTAGRSKAFHDACWRNVADAGLKDRVAWIKALGAKHPECDLSRVGIYGTSAGGQTALRALLMHGDFYRAGVADCGCHDNRVDKQWWNEQWMGYPVGPHYAEQSNVVQAHRLSGDLLLMVGEVDTNVDPACTMQVVDALVKADKDFELLVAPGVGHGVVGTPYGKRRLLDFFVRKLLKVEPRRES